MILLLLIFGLLLHFTLFERVWSDSEDVWVVQSLFAVSVLLSCFLTRGVPLLLFKYVKSSVVIVGTGPLICILLFWGDENSMKCCSTAVGALVSFEHNGMAHIKILV
jgi:hypothetical protein